MDHDRFDGLTHSLATAASRRGLGRTLAGGGFGALLSSAFGALNVEAKKKGNHRKKKKTPRPQPVFNQFGCRDVGQPCRGNSTLCCSGVCAGQKPKKGKKDASTCVAHNAGACTLDSCTATHNIHCNVANTSCFCATTTGKATFCGNFSLSASQLCRVCSRDTDCAAEFGPGAACVVLGGLCAALCPATGGTACVPACI